MFGACEEAACSYWDHWGPLVFYGIAVEALGLLLGTSLGTLT